MVFSSLLFVLAFLPIQSIFYFTAKDITKRNIILLVFSLIFYAWGESVYVLILLGMSFFCWLFSLKISAAQTATNKKLWLALAAVVCIGTIGFFKYIGFFITNLNHMAGKVLLTPPAISLPIGISFYTFQLLTYVVDVYRGEVPAQKVYWKVLLYAGLFHQCVAGPIVRYGDIAYEIDNRVENLDDMARGVRRFAVGLAKKSLLANACGAVVDTLLLSDDLIGDASALASNLSLLQGRSALTLWVGMAFYMLQIYLDFSAYSDMAIGMGLMCGFHYKENFSYPYVSSSITEFWRRWHISLGSFFRDYVYIPMGGNRKGAARQIFNLFVVWALTGLWHGASWNFVLWGLYFFVFLMLEKFVIGERLKETRVLKHVYVLAIVFFGWVLFKFTNLSMVGAVLRGMFCLNKNHISTFESLRFAGSYLFFFFICVIACTPLVKNAGRILARMGKTNMIARKTYGVLHAVLPAVLIILSVLSLVGDSYNPFLYFQF